MNEGLNIVPFVPTEENAVALARTYARVFAGDPWNEVTKCVGCNRFFGPDTVVGQICRGDVCGGMQLGEAYPALQTAQDLLSDTTREGAIASILMRDGNPIPLGFAIGFPEDLGAFVEDRYKSTEGRNEMSGLFTELKQDGSFYYISEVGLAEDERGKGWSNLLVDTLTNEADRRDLGLLMRTNRQSPMIAVARRARMRQIMGPEVAISEQYQPNGGDMKLVRKIITSGDPVNMMDPENPERVLFIATRSLIRGTQARV